MESQQGEFLVLPPGESVDLSIWLCNFDINKHQLKSEYRDALRTYVFPVLVAGGSATIAGMASRTGSAQHIVQLSQRRATAVSLQLIAYTGQVDNRLRTVLGVGEAAASPGDDYGRARAGPARRHHVTRRPRRRAGARPHPGRAAPGWQALQLLAR